MGWSCLSLSGMHFRWDWQGVICLTYLLDGTFWRACTPVTRCRFPHKNTRKKSQRKKTRVLGWGAHRWPSVTNLHRQLLGGPGGHRLGRDPHCTLLASNHLLPLAEVVPAGSEERFRGREDLGEGGVAGDRHRIVEAQLTPRKPPARNTPHVSNSSSAAGASFLSEA